MNGSQTNPGLVAEAKRPYLVTVWLSRQEMLVLASLVRHRRTNRSALIRQLIENAYGQTQNVPEPVAVAGAAPERMEQER